MLIYEKNNKLNINFDNEVSENPDLQINKEDGKTDVLIDGQPVGGSVMVIDLNNEKVDLTVALADTPDETMDMLGIMVDTEIDVGTVIVEEHHAYNDPFVEYRVSQWAYALMSGVDPSLVPLDCYTFTGSRIVWVFGDNVVIVPPSLAKDLIPGTKINEGDIEFK